MTISDAASNLGPWNGNQILIDPGSNTNIVITLIQKKLFSKMGDALVRVLTVM